MIRLVSVLIGLVLSGLILWVGFTVLTVGDDPTAAMVIFLCAIFVWANQVFQPKNTTKPASKNRNDSLV